jgi:hypothetical protein
MKPTKKPTPNRDPRIIIAQVTGEHTETRRDYIQVTQPAKRDNEPDLLRVNIRVSVATTWPPTPARSETRAPQVKPRRPSKPKPPKIAPAVETQPGKSRARRSVDL